MKKWIWILCLLLLCGCEREVEEAPVVETPPVVEAAPVVSETEPELPPVEGLPFYIYDPDLRTEDNAIDIIAPDGSVLLELSEGRAEPLINGFTGEYEGLLVRHRVTGGGYNLDPGADTRLDAYDMEMQQFYDYLTACGYELYGDLEVINAYSRTKQVASLHNRATDAWVSGQFRWGQVQGDCVLAETVEGGYCCFDEHGLRTDIPMEVEQWLVRDGRLWLVVTDGEGNKGLMDSKGNQPIPCSCREITVYGSHALCLDREGRQVVMDLETGETVLQTFCRRPYTILRIYADHALVYDEKGQLLLVDWQGNACMSAGLLRIFEYDLTGDGVYDWFYLSDGEQVTFYWPNGTVRAAFAADPFTLRVVGHSAVAWIEDDRVVVRDLDTGKTGDFTLIPNHGEITPLYQDGALSGLFSVWEYDQYKLYWDDGTPVTDNFVGGSGLQGTVIACEKDGDSGLKEADGGWLYRRGMEPEFGRTHAEPQRVKTEAPQPTEERQVIELDHALAEPAPLPEDMKAEATPLLQRLMQVDYGQVIVEQGGDPDTQVYLLRQVLLSQLTDAEIPWDTIQELTGSDIYYADPGNAAARFYEELEQDAVLRERFLESDHWVMTWLGGTHYAITAVYEDNSRLTAEIFERRAVDVEGYDTSVRKALRRLADNGTDSHLVPPEIREEFVTYLMRDLSYSWHGEALSWHWSVEEGGVYRLTCQYENIGLYWDYRDGQVTFSQTVSENPWRAASLMEECTAELKYGATGRLVLTLGCTAQAQVESMGIDSVDFMWDTGEKWALWQTLTGEELEKLQNIPSEPVGDQYRTYTTHVALDEPKLGVPYKAHVKFYADDGTERETKTVTSNPVLTK